ncbi:hypothetical protein Taro_046713 [Colocasia esculenta]|uniref:DEK-C domain-containing protein n=1 Tax=Colocasia esculenta TaxID=4460 RepID=A0A843X7K5_COLES|nr:hypothetical protein [Colocasia esculenta]
MLSFSLPLPRHRAALPTAAAPYCCGRTLPPQPPLPHHRVAYKLSKKRPTDIKSLHQLLFGRKGKAINFKSHIFQFSGFVWHENEDKQRAKVKEKLDKCVKDKLLDLCDVFDIPVSRATSRKEDLVGKLLDFMVAPHATTDVILAEKEQSAKSRKRKRMSGRGALRRGISMKRSGKRTKSEKMLELEKNAVDTEEEDEDGDTGEDKENGLSDKDESTEHSESEEEESEHDNAAKESEYSGKGGSGAKKLLKKQSSPTTKTKKVASPKKRPQPTSIKSPRKPYSKRFKVDAAKNSPKEVSRNRKNVVTPKKKPSSNSDMEEKKTSGDAIEVLDWCKKAGRSRSKTEPAEKSGPAEEELRQTICEILKEVDFNTATFTDILKRLASHYDMDLTARKASIKVMIQDELTKLADEADGEDDDSDDEADTEKAENLEPAGKEVEA